MSPGPFARVFMQEGDDVLGKSALWEVGTSVQSEGLEPRQGCWGVKPRGFRP